MKEIMKMAFLERAIVKGMFDKCGPKNMFSEFNFALEQFEKVYWN